MQDLGLCVDTDDCVRFESIHLPFLSCCCFFLRFQPIRSQDALNISLKLFRRLSEIPDVIGFSLLNLKSHSFARVNQCPTKRGGKVTNSLVPGVSEVIKSRRKLNCILRCFILLSSITCSRIVCITIPHHERFSSFVIQSSLNM